MTTKSISIVLVITGLVAVFTLSWVIGVVLAGVGFVLLVSSRAGAGAGSFGGGGDGGDSGSGFFGGDSDGGDGGE